MINQTGRVVILSGPSGSGKTTLSKKLLLSRKFKGTLVKSVSVTTRPKRNGERHGRDYFFISRKQFLAKRQTGHFLESKKVFGSYYGTPRKNVGGVLKAGKHILLCIDVKGAKDVALEYPSALKIFVKPPSFEELKRRLSKRATESSEGLKRRLQTALKEMNEAGRYDFIVTNDSLTKAYQEIDNILSRELFPRESETFCM